MLEFLRPVDAQLGRRRAYDTTAETFAAGKKGCEMKLRLLNAFTVAIVLLGAVAAHAQVAPWHATIAYGGAYDITYDEETPLYTYTWMVTFNGIDTGAENERMRAFALYYLPDEALPLTGQEEADTIYDPVAARGSNTNVSWSFPNPNAPVKGNTAAWLADNPTSDPAGSDAVFVGESIGYFKTTFDNPLPDWYLEPTNEIYSGIHVQWTDSDGDQSEWVNHTPEPVSAVLLALGIPVALAARRRRED